MAYDMGQATAKITLDISDVNKKTAEVEKDFEAISKSSDVVVKSIEEQAKAFDKVLGQAYKTMEKSLSPIQKAYQALDTLVDENNKKVQKAAEVAKSAASVQTQAHERVVASYKQVEDAQRRIDELLKEYTELQRLNQLPNRNFDLAAEEKKYIDALNEKYNLEQKYNEAVKAEVAATQQAAQAQQTYQTVLKQTNEVNAKAQNDLNTYEAKQAQYNENKLRQTKEIKEVNKQQADERKKQLEDEKAALENAEAAQKKAAEQQALAFGIAAKAVDEVVEGVKKLTQELLNLGKQVLDIGSDFETSMAKVAATTGMTAGDVSARISDYQDLVGAAKEAGLTTIFSASQAGEALNYLALAGYNVEQSIETMPDILTIAAAGAMDLGRASDMVTDAMNALDLEIGTTSDFIDKMAKTAQSSNTNVEQLGNAILTVGGTATVLSGGVTELDTALGLLANSGIKARVGGTALRQILLNLTAPAKAGAEMIEQLGLKVFDAEGNLRPLKDIFTDLNVIMADFTDQQRMEALNAIFDKRQIRAANALLQATGEKWDNLEAKINSAEGAAERMAETMRSNLNGALNIAKSNLENIAITIYDGIVKNITSLVKEAIPKSQELNKVLASPEVQARLQKISKEIKDIGLNLLDKVIKVVPEVIKFFSEAEVHVKSLAIALSGLLVVFNSKKIIDELIGIATALKLVKSFVLQNPYAILAIAMAEVLALAIELDNALTQQYKDMAAQVRAETDLWEKQRDVVENVTNDWNSYLETQGDSVKSAEDHAEAVRQLYYQYMNLVESGKDATLALEALKEEVPELQDMLDDGKDSFEDITKAVDDYTEALLRSARAEAGKDLYIQAFETQAKAQRAYDDATEAVKDNEKALREAEKAVEDYSAKFDDPNSAWDIDELERLKETRDALRETLEENKKARDVAKTTLDSTTKAMEKAEADYTEFIRGEAEERGELFDSEASAYAEGAKKQSDSWKRAEEERAKRSEATANEIKAELEKLDAKIAIGEANEYDKIDLFKRYFGNGFDKEKFSITNKDITSFYAEYSSLLEKKNNEIQKQMEADQKERERIAKENEKKQKEQDAEWTKLIEKGLSDIDWTAGFEEWDLQEQIEAYKKYLKDNEKFYATHAEEREKITRKIQELEKDAAKEQTKVGDEAAKAYIEAWTEGYDKLIDKAASAYQALEKKREDFQNNLLKGVKLYTEESTKVWNRFTQQYEEDKGMKVSSKNMKEQLKELQDYDKAIEKLRAKGVSEDLITEVLGMDTEKGLEFANALNKMSTKELNEYQAAYQAVHDKAAEMTSEYYKSELQKWEQEYMIPLKEYVSGDQSQLRVAYERLGIDSVQGYLDGLSDKADEAEGATKAIYAGCLQDVKDILGIHSPSTEFYEVGVNVIEGFLNGVQSKAEMLANIFKSLGQKAGDAFVNAFKQTWDNFVDLITIGGGLTVPTTMVAPTFGTPMLAGNQVVYATTDNTYTSGGLTKEDIVSAVREALPGGDVVLTIDKSEFGKISRDALNGLAENSEMGLKV